MGLIRLCDFFGCLAGFECWFWPHYDSQVVGLGIAGGGAPDDFADDRVMELLDGGLVGAYTVV